MLKFFDISLGKGTGCSCRRCGSSTPDEYRGTDDILADVSSAINAWQDMGPGPNIAFSGPEPYRHGRLPMLVQNAVSSGARRLSLSTDAVALALPDYAAGSIDAGVRHIEVPLLGGSPEGHDDLTGSAESFVGTVTGMRSFKAAGADKGIPVLVCGRVRVCSHNVRELPAIVLAYAQVGADSVTFEIDGSVPRTVVRPWIGAAAETGVVNNVWVAVSGISAAEYRIPELHEHEAVSIIPLPGGASV